MSNKNWQKFIRIFLKNYFLLNICWDACSWKYMEEYFEISWLGCVTGMLLILQLILMLDATLEFLPAVQKL